MMPRLPLLILALAFIVLASNAALFPKSSNVQQIDAKGFRKAVKQNMTFVTAFVAPWCGHCQKLAPELVRAANGLHPLVPVYAVDCDDNKNKHLCADQGVKGFPTIKLYPSGKNAPPLEFDGTRSASSIFYWASRRVPATVSRTQTVEGIAEFVAKNSGKPKTILLNKGPKIPLLWKVLSNKYSDRIAFGNCRDRQGNISVELGYEAGEQSKPKVLIYGRDDTLPLLYEGVLKFAALSKFFDQVIDGTVEVSRASLDAKQEVLDIPESERRNLDDETRIGDAGYGGFNPHEGLDIEEFLKRGIPNPHATGSPGARFHATSPGNSDGSASSSVSTKQSSAAETLPSDAQASSEPYTATTDGFPSETVASPGDYAKDEL